MYTNVRGGVVTKEKEQSILITVDEATQLLCYHRTKIYAMIQKKELKAVGEGRGLRIVRASVDRWVKQQTE